MTHSPESALALQRHYVGALSKPSGTWLEPLPATRLAFAGTAVRVDAEGCTLDFGTVDSARGQKRGVRVFQPGKRPAAVRVSEAPEWVTTEWTDNGSLLVVQITDDHEGSRSGKLSLWVRDDAGARLEKLRIAVSAKPRDPFAEISFNGSPTPRPFAFGTEGGLYTIAVNNRNSVPLGVSFSDLPAWLEMTVDGCRRKGPIAGLFFERTAPFTVSLRPLELGRHEGAIRMRTNDRAAELRDVTLQLSADIAPLRAHIRVIPPSPLEGRKKVTAKVKLENWGRLPARITASSDHDAVSVPPVSSIEAAREGQPGTVHLTIRIATGQFAPGAHDFSIALQIEDGDPPYVAIPIRVNVASAPPRERRELRLDIVAAFVALIILTFVLLAAARGWP